MKKALQARAHPVGIEPARPPSPGLQSLRVAPARPKGPLPPPAPALRRPLGEAPLARKTAILAFVFLLAAALDLALEGISLASLARAFPLYALGGFSVLIFGTSRLLISGMAGRDIAGGVASSVAVAGLGALGAAGLFAAQDGPARVRVAFALVWGLAAVGHAVVTLVTVRRPAMRPPVRDELMSPRSRLPLRVLEAGSLAYALAGGVVVPLASAARVAPAAAVHVVLVGFVIVTIMGTASHILPRFTRQRIPPALLASLAPLALAGPALVALGLGGVRALLAPGALVEGAAFALFATAVLTMVARADRFRAPNLLYAGAPLAIGVGGLVALVFALDGRLADKLALHGVLNVFGFVGLFVLGASSDLYGPALQAGALPATRHAYVAAALSLAGLLGAAVGGWLDAPLVARAGMLAFASAVAWQLAGLVSAHRRAGRVVMKAR